METFDCQICVEKYNKSTRKKIVCFHCNIETCLECCKTFLLNSKEEPHCMDCKKPWDRMFLTNNFPKSWIHNEYKNHRENVLEERHDAILQTYQVYVVSKRRIRDYEKEIELLNIQISELNNQKNRVKRWIQNENNFIEEIDNEQPESREVLEMIVRGENREKIEQEKEKKREDLLKQRGPCPKDNCKGFISEGWMCGVCESKICKSCMLDITDTPAENPHECKEEDKESAKQIRKDSKNCPKCRIRIFKISGCSQIWCTNCHIFFDWNTLEIIRHGMVHNPHYIEYLQRNGGNAPALIEGICGNRNIEWNELRTSSRCSNRENDFRRFLSRQLRKVYETMESNQDARRENMDSINKQLGISYLQNNIANDYRKYELQKRQKQLDKLSDTLDVRELWCDQVYTYIFNYVRNSSSMEDTEKGVNDITKYCEESMKNVGKWYNSKAPRITLSRWETYYY